MLLEGGPLDSSVDPAFDLETLSEYRRAIKSGVQATDEWIDRWSGEWEKHQNANY